MEESPPPKRSTAEHFADLRASVDTMRTQMMDVHDYVVKARQRLDESRKELELRIQTKAAKDAARVIFLIYCTTYKHLANPEKGAEADEQTTYLHTLQDLIREELRSMGCDVLAPQIGETFQATWMTSLEKKPLTPGAQEGTVALVYSPALVIPAATRVILEKAQVAVFRAEETQA